MSHVTTFWLVPTGALYITFPKLAARYSRDVAELTLKELAQLVVAIQLHNPVFISTWWINKPALTCWLFPLGCYSLTAAAGCKPAQVTLTLQLLTRLYPGAHFRAWLCSLLCWTLLPAQAAGICHRSPRPARSSHAQELLLPVSLVSND